MLVDLSHVITDGMTTYPGLPGPLVCHYLSREASRAHYADGTEFQIGRIELVSNTGTYVDVPFHRFAEGVDLADQGLEPLAGRPALVGIDAVNIDDLADGTRPAHTVLLGAGIPICEHLRGLDALPTTGARFFAVPPRFRGVGTFPVRAYAEVADP